MSHKPIFTSIYENKVWGDNNNPDYNGSSGGGSEVDYNLAYTTFLRKFIVDKKIKVIMDLGCGDFKCGKEIYDGLNITYFGYDAYDKLVQHNRLTFPGYNFICKDIYNERENLLPGDLCILKDIMQHWSLDCIYIFLDYIIAEKVYDYILVVNCSDQTEDDTNITTGGGRPLSCDYMPLKKYGFKKLFNYNTKEVSLLKIE